MNARVFLICIMVSLAFTIAFKVRRAIRDGRAGCGPLTALENKRSSRSLAAPVPPDGIGDIGNGHDITQD